MNFTTDMIGFLPETSGPTMVRPDPLEGNPLEPLVLTWREGARLRHRRLEEQPFGPPGSQGGRLRQNEPGSRYGAKEAAADVKPRRRRALLKLPALGPIFPLPEHDQQRRRGHPCATASAQTECHPGHRPGSHTLR